MCVNLEDDLEGAITQLQHCLLSSESIKSPLKPLDKTSMLMAETLLPVCVEV